MKAPHWYMRNWEYEQRMKPNGSVHDELVYKGEYYQLSEQAMPAKRLKAVFLALALFLCADLAVLLSHFSLGAYLFFVGGAAAVTLIPTIYLLLGCIRSLSTGKKMTYRDLRGTYYRIRRASLWITVLMVICFIGELFFVVFRMARGLSLVWSSELLWLIGSALGVGVGAGNLLLYARNRIDLLPMEC